MRIIGFFISSLHKKENKNYAKKSISKRYFYINDVISDGIRHDLLQYLPECGRNEQRSIPDGFRRTENHVAGCLRSGICFR